MAAKSALPFKVHVHVVKFKILYSDLKLFKKNYTKKMGNFIEPGTQRSTNIKVKIELL